MTLKSKYENNEKVWFILRNPIFKVCEGIIRYVFEWNNDTGFNYSIEHINKDGELIEYFIRESDIYYTKEEILENLFEENGELKENPTE